MHRPRAEENNDRSKVQYATRARTLVLARDVYSAIINQSQCLFSGEDANAHKRASIRAVDRLEHGLLEPAFRGELGSGVGN